MSRIESEDKLDEILRHVDPRSDLDSIPPAVAVDKYLDSRSSEVTVNTLEEYEDNLRNFVEFCEEREIQQVKNLDGATLDDLKVWIREEVPEGTGEYSPKTMRDQMYLVRNFLRYLEQIEAVPEGLHKKVDVPELEVTMASVTSSSRRNAPGRYSTTSRLSSMRRESTSCGSFYPTPGVGKELSTVSTWRTAT